MITYMQLKKKLHRACLDSGLSDDEVIRVLTETLLENIIFRSPITGDSQQQLKQIAKSVVYDILNGVSVDTEAAKALYAELYYSLRSGPAQEDKRHGCCTIAT